MYAKFFKRLLDALLALLGLVALALLGIAILGRVAPEWLDGFLYSPEELEILHK